MERIDDLGINGLKILQNTDYFLFGVDSVVLANIAKDYVKTDNIILDLGTGSSVIPTIMSAKSKAKLFIGVELQKEMYELALKNNLMNNLEDKIKVINEDIKKVENIRKKIIEYAKKDTVDLIVTNPPYKEILTGTINENEIKYIARHEKECKLEDIFNTASKLLKFKGKLVIVHKPERLVDLLESGRKYDLEAKEVRFLKAREDSIKSLVFITYVKGGLHECKVLEDIVEYDKDGNYTDKIKKMYNET